jgi:hypothetical protein
MVKFKPAASKFALSKCEQRILWSKHAKENGYKYATDLTKEEIKFLKCKKKELNDKRKRARKLKKENEEFRTKFLKQFENKNGN